MNVKNQVIKRLLSALFIVVMLFIFVPVLPSDGIESVEAAETMFNKPRRDNGEVTYDCVWFGNYPQAEMVTTALYEKYKSENAASFRENNFIVDDTVYQTLEEANGWDANGDIVLPNGEKYRRIQKGDVTRAVYWGVYIDWEHDDTYHYFKYQPIKWKVLSTNKSEAFLLAEWGLDCQEYHMASNEPVTWETCTMRSWLNGYGRKSNKRSTDYTTKNFINSAFNSKERNAIKRKKIKNKEYVYDELRRVKYDKLGNSTKDKIFLLSYDNALNPDYGFSSYKDRNDKAKQIRSSAYALAMGAHYAVNSKGEGIDWELRSIVGEHESGFEGGIERMYVTFLGVISRNYMYEEYLGASEGGLVVPALYLDLSASDLWSYAGTVSVKESRNGLVEENGKSYYYRYNKKKVKYTGLMKNADNKWYYVKNGVWQPKYTGMAKRSNGKWYYVEKGIKKNMTGLVKHTDGKWWYVKKGEWRSKYRGIVKQSNGKRYYVENGKRKDITGYVTVKGKRYKLKKGEVKSI